jgi:hydrogenase nickel incorporation protein HypA/HybF
MHEYSLVEALITRVEAEARRRGALKVHGLSVRLGELAGVDAGLFQTAYDTFRAGTICAEVPLTLKQVAASWSCPTCRAAIPRGAPLRCDACAGPARLDEGGDALTLDGIDLEIP